MKNNQSGFAAVIVALIVAAAVLAGTGVWVYQTQIIKPKIAPMVQKTETQPVVNEEEAKKNEESRESMENNRFVQIVSEETADAQKESLAQDQKNERDFQSPDKFDEENLKPVIDSCQNLLKKTDNELKLVGLPEDCGKIIDIGKGFENWKYILIKYDWNIDNDPYTGPVLVFWDANGKFVQKITETLENAWYFYNGGINFDDDINFDGYNDLKIMVNSGPGAGFTAVSYDYWIFDPIVGKYKKSQILNKIKNPNLDKDKKLIISGFGLGNSCFIDRTCIGGVETIYKFANGFWHYAYDQVNLPKFEDFPAKKIYVGNLAEINFAKHPGAEEFNKTGGATGAYKGLIEGDVAKGPNFNDHYRVIEWSCGSNCKAVMIVDVATGEIIYSPFIDDENNRPDFSPWENLDYRVDSSLLAVNGKYYSWMPWMSSEIYVDNSQ